MTWVVVLPRPHFTTRGGPACWTPTGCGTYGGFQRHLRVHHEEPCKLCRLAKNAYITGRRWAGGRQVESEMRARHARSRALEALAKHHPVEFRMLIEQERYLLAQAEAS